MILAVLSCFALRLAHAVKFANIGFLSKRRNSVLFNHMQLRDCQSVIDLTDCAGSTSLLQFFLMVLA